MAGGKRPYGYADIFDFERRLDTELSGDQWYDADAYLRMAEELVFDYTGGRTFLPVRGVLATNCVTNDTTLYLTLASATLPENQVLLIGSELVQYSQLSEPDPVTATNVTLTVTDRAHGSTTAASHNSNTVCYLVKQYDGEDKSLFTEDFLDWNTLYYGTEATIVQAFTQTNDIYPGPIGAPPYQWLNAEDGNFSEGVRYWLAATWGYSWTCPTIVKQATLEIAAYHWQRRGINDTIASQSVEGLKVSFRDPVDVPPVAARMLDRYKKRRL